jgi:hypothetical protein
MPSTMLPPWWHGPAKRRMSMLSLLAGPFSPCSIDHCQITVEIA